MLVGCLQGVLSTFWPPISFLVSSIIDSMFGFHCRYPSLPNIAEPDCAAINSVLSALAASRKRSQFRILGPAVRDHFWQLSCSVRFIPPEGPDSQKSRCSCRKLSASLLLIYLSASYRRSASEAIGYSQAAIVCPVFPPPNRTLVCQLWNSQTSRRCLYFSETYEQATAR